jgi:hypothetical protein
MFGITEHICIIRIPQSEFLEPLNEGPRTLTFFAVTLFPRQTGMLVRPIFTIFVVAVTKIVRAGYGFWISWWMSLRMRCLVFSLRVQLRCWMWSSMPGVRVMRV